MAKMTATLPTPKPNMNDTILTTMLSWMMDHFSLFPREFILIANHQQNDYNGSVLNGDDDGCSLPTIYYAIDDCGCQR